MPFKRSLKDERGVILVITLLIIALLIGAGAGAMALVQTDLKISANLKNGTKAFYLAEAGIEWAKQQVKDAAANPPSPSDDSESLSPGSFSVVFSNPTIQSQLAGVVTAESTGTVGSSSSKIRALLKKTYELSDGAISVRGTEASSNFTGNSFVVDGRDYDPASGTLVVGAKAQYGISVSNSTLEGQVEGALSSPQEDNVVGKGGSTPDVEQSGFLPTDEVEELANNLCRSVLLFKVKGEVFLSSVDQGRGQYAIGFVFLASPPIPSLVEDFKGISRTDVGVKIYVPGKNIHKLGDDCGTDPQTNSTLIKRIRYCPSNGLNLSLIGSLSPPKDNPLIPLLPG